MGCAVINARSAASGTETGSIAGRAVSGDLLPLASGTGDAICDLRLNGIEFAAAITAGELDLCVGRVGAVVTGCEATVEFDAGCSAWLVAGSEIGGCVGNGDGAAEPLLEELLAGCDPTDEGVGAAGCGVFACAWVLAACPPDARAESAGVAVPSEF